MAKITRRGAEATGLVGFRPKARILQLLGDELIGSPRLAVFELVKNAYDADAKNVLVKLEHLNPQRARIVVRDDGVGMSAATIRNVWLTPASDHRRRQREVGMRSALGRLPLGEKGLGLFAVHKLGEHIRVVTRELGAQEVVVDLDWREMLNSDFLDEVRVPVTERPPVTFAGARHGTRIRITQLRAEWTRGEIRDLHRSLTSIADPTGGPSDFRVKLLLPGNEDIVEDLPDPAKILELALWEFSFVFDGANIECKYKFKPYGGIKVEPASLEGCEPLLRSRDKKKVVADTRLIEGIGPVSGSFHVFDRDRETHSIIQPGRSGSRAIVGGR